MTQAILFDVDGTLLNTNEYIYQAFEYSLLKQNKSLNREKIRAIMGKPLGECYRILTGFDLVEDFITDHRTFQNEHLHLSSAFPGAKETLRKIQKNGIRIAAITSRAKDSATATLEQAGLMEYIELFIGIEDVLCPKPDPEGIFKALSYFGISPTDAIMVGDSDVDIQSGKSAGTKTIGVTYGFHGSKITESFPDFVIQKISEIPSLL